MISTGGRWRAEAYMRIKEPAPVMAGLGGMADADTG